MWRWRGLSGWGANLQLIQSRLRPRERPASHAPPNQVDTLGDKIFAAS